MSDFIKDAVKRLDKTYSNEKLPEEIRGLLLVLKSELLTAEKANSTMIAVISLVYIECMYESQKITASAKELGRSFNDLKTTVNQNKAQIMRFNSKVQKFKSQENRLYHTIEGMYKAMQLSKDKYKEEPDDSDK